MRDGFATRRDLNNDGDPASGQEVRNADAADGSVRTDSSVSGVLAPPRPTRVPPGPG